ncbi:cell division ATP-binding protein FtsE [candidate division WWE3 bacterium]|nr:cell division ATP-binding protein FtsE [candidate division WWE3 bacterium]
MIKFDSVSKWYKRSGVTAFEEVSLQINQGDFVFLIGPSGAGKTTLLKFLIREDIPSEGDIWFKDDNIVRLPRRKIPHLRRQIGMVFQDFKLLRQQTVFENIAFALEVVGKKPSEVKEIVPYLLDRVGLLHRERAFPQELSTGEQQRVAIARALATEPEVLLADEPTGNLDSQNTKQIVDLLKQINEWGTTVIMATHDEALVKRTKGRVVVIKDGRLTEQR